MAREILNNHKFERQRKMRDLSLARYSRAMKLKDFKPGTPIHIGVKQDASGYLYYLLDGQHRLESVARTGEAQWFVCIFHTIGNEEDLNDLYSRFDMHAKRSVNDILAAQNMAQENALEA